MERTRTTTRMQFSDFDIKSDTSLTVIGIIAIILLIFSAYSHYKVYKYKNSREELPAKFRIGNYIFYAIVIILIAVAILSFVDPKYCFSIKSFM